MLALMGSVMILAIAPGGVVGASSSGLITGPVQYGQSDWEVVPVSLAADNDLLVSCIAASTCLASGDGPNNGAVFFKTTDGGITWNQVSSYPFGIGDLSCIKTGICVAVPYGGDPHLAVSPDAGKSWLDISQPPFMPANLHADTVACTAAFCIVTGGDGNGNIPAHGQGAFETHDLGKTWTPISLPAPTKDVQAMSCDADGRCFLVYDTYTNQFSDMAKSTDQGRTWTPVKKAPGFTSLDGFSCPAHNACVYLATKVLEVSKDGAHTWVSNRGPFGPKNDRSAYAWTISCVAVSQCMIGGSLGDQSVVWIQGRPWPVSRLHASFRGLVAKSDHAFNVRAQHLAAANTSTSFVAAFNSLEDIVQSNQAAAGSLELHARGADQTDLELYGKGWDRLLNGLSRAADDGNHNKDTSADFKGLGSVLRRIEQSERSAGLHGGLNLGAFRDESSQGASSSA